MGDPLYRRKYPHKAAAVCAVLDADWTRAALQAVLAHSTDQDATIECRAALLESRFPAARQAVEAWEAQHPDPDPGSHLTDRFLYRLWGQDCSRALRE